MRSTEPIRSQPLKHTCGYFLDQTRISDLKRP